MSPEPLTRVASAYERIEAHRRRDPAVWIDLVEPEVARARAAEVGGPGQPLAGVPFAVKDNLDVAGRRTSAACPAFAYEATESAPAVDRLLDAGAILLGKTNMDQFATGLVGTRSPYGVPQNVGNPDFIPGGSSSGSAVAVAAGLVPLALGTDTAGSGRVPAALNGIVGLKPTRGLISTRGVVPASRSYDCVSVFTRTIGEAAAALDVLEWPDPLDPFARRRPAATSRVRAGRVGVPGIDSLEFFGDDEARLLHEAAIERLARTCELVIVDVAQFVEAGELLYGGALIAERVAAFGDFVRARPNDVDPSVRAVIGQAEALPAVRLARDLERLAQLRHATERIWDEVDAIALPTVGTTYTVAQIAEHPLARNATLGRYTNFVNLLDLCALAAPAGVRENGVPVGISLIAPAFCESTVLEIGAAFLGEPEPAVAAAGGVDLAVVGAHLTGQPLNHQLTDRGGVLVRTTATSPDYRLFALADTTPAKPGLVFDPPGAAIEVEVWRLPEEGFGSFVAEVPPPLAIGTLSLADGSAVSGFVCEPRGLAGACEITELGGWRAYLASG